MVQDNDGNLLKLQLPGGQQAAMAGNDAGIRVHQNRIVETELGDARGDLGDLGIGVGPGIPGIGRQSVNWPMLDVFGHGL
jgi:hypothetical protein